MTSNSSYIQFTVLHREMHSTRSRGEGSRCKTTFCRQELQRIVKSGNTTEFKSLPTRPRSHRYILIYIFATEFVKICRFKTFWVRIFARRTLLLFRCLNIYVKMCVLLKYCAKNEFKRCVYLNTNSNSSRYIVFKICRFKTSLVGIFALRTLFPFRYFSIHVKDLVCALLTYSAIKWA